MCVAATPRWSVALLAIPAVTDAARDHAREDERGRANETARVSESVRERIEREDTQSVSAKRSIVLLPEVPEAAHKIAVTRQVRARE